LGRWRAGKNSMDVVGRGFADIHSEFSRFENHESGGIPRQNGGRGARGCRKKLPREASKVGERAVFFSSSSSGGRVSWDQTKKLISGRGGKMECWGKNDFPVRLGEHQRGRMAGHLQGGAALCTWGQERCQGMTRDCWTTEPAGTCKTWWRRMRSGHGGAKRSTVET